MAALFQDELDEHSPALFQDEASDDDGGLHLQHEPEEPDGTQHKENPVHNHPKKGQLFQDECDEPEGFDQPSLLGDEHSESLN